MKKAVLIFLVGAAAGAGGFWFLQQAKTKSHIAEARDRVTYAAWKAGKSLKEFADEIKQELARSGQVVRAKATPPADAITGSLRTKLLAESGLRGVGVETTNAVVTLTGEVTTHEDIARAMKLALETDGVHKVVSKIQISAGK